MVSPNFERTDATKTAYSYAWEWFKYHADQRIRLLQFYLIAITILSAAYHQSITRDKYGLAAATAFFAAFVGIAFLRLEQRTRELVKISEAFLKEVEDALAQHVGDKIRFADVADSKKSGGVGPLPDTFYSYGQILFWFYIGMIAVCLVAAIYAISGT
jgi:hypothetical protein